MMRSKLPDMVLTEVSNPLYLSYAMVVAGVDLHLFWCIFLCAPMHLFHRQHTPNRESGDNALSNAC